MLDKAITVTRTFDSSRGVLGGGFAKILVYEFTVGQHGPFREEFMANEQTPETINHRLNMKARMLRETGALGTGEV